MLRVWCVPYVALTIFMLAMSGPTGASAQSADDIGALNRQVAQLYGQGKYAEAAAAAQKALAQAERMLGKEHPLTLQSANNLAALYDALGQRTQAGLLYRRTLATREQVLGKDHPDTLSSVNNLAGLYSAQGRFAQAGQLYRRALAARERVLGKDHPDTLTTINNLAVSYKDQGRYAEAEPLYRRALAAQERVLGKDHPAALLSLNNLAVLFDAQGRYAEAEPLYRRALATQERVLGKDHPDTLLSLNNLAELYRNQSRYAEAEPLYRRALAARKRVLGKDHPDTLTSLNNLAGLRKDQGRYSEAEPLYRRVLAAQERVSGKDHPSTLLSVNNLAELYYAQGRYAEAEPLYRRALAAQERVLGKDHPSAILSISNLAEMYYALGRYAKAEPLYRFVLGARERLLGKEHPVTLQSVNNLAALYEAQGRYAEAEPLYRHALTTQERVSGKDHPDTLASLNNLAFLYHVQGRYAEAEPLYRRALKAQERVLGNAHPNTLASLNNLAMLYFAQSGWSRAADFWRRSTATISARTQRGVQTASVTGRKKSEVQRKGYQYWGLVKATYRLAPEGRAPGFAAAREMFQTAQWTLSSEAARSLAQMAARGAVRIPRVAAMARERQDLVREWQKREALHNAALGRETHKRDAKAEAENNGRMATIDARIAQIDKRLAAEFPDYATLANPAPVPVEEVQEQLGADEALVLFLDTPRMKPAPEETFIWVVTKTDVRWLRSGRGTAKLTRDVQALRCGLDAAAWRTPRCARLTGAQFTEASANAGKPLPFGHARAHRLYKALFGQAEDLIEGKHLLIVPSGPLTQLPFQVLVTAPPVNGDHKSAAWLARSHAVTILPAVSSLKALRRVSQPSHATKPLIGFGNPLLDGPRNDPQYGAYYKKRAELARGRQQCGKSTSPRRIAVLSRRGGVKAIQTRRGLAQISHIRMQAPLPETATELCAVARDLKAGPAEMRLGARATEHEVKRLSASGQLAQYRVVHFATHGALAGELNGASEPGLLLTPPAIASETDDGYLSASEIASLKLDADWVILSACNTAAGDAESAQALSGLARAFIYAQARALLVSHWAVDSGAAVKLITGAMREMASDPEAGRAEALRRSMLALLDKGDAREAHPASWSPFAVVGEGAR